MPQYIIRNVAGLNKAIEMVNDATTGNFALDPAPSLNLMGQAVEAINLQPNVTLNIDGDGHTLDGGVGNTTQRGLFVYAGTVNINDLAINDMVAKGGNGGFGAAAAGPDWAADCSSGPM